MSLESQLHAKADEQFKKAYANLFAEFANGIRQLTGLNLLDGYQERPKEIDQLKSFLSLRYFEGDPVARSVYQAAQTLHRERFIAEFVRSVEHTQSFLGEQP